MSKKGRGSEGQRSGGQTAKAPDDQSGTLADVMDGRGVPFTSGGQAFIIRQPTTEEYDDALALQNLTMRRMLALPTVAELRSEPCTDGERTLYERMIEGADAEARELEDGARKRALLDEIARLQRTLEDRTLADELASDRAVLARDRFLCQRLLCDEDGVQMLDPKAADFRTHWEALPLQVKDDARMAIWVVLGMVQRAPFSWDRLRRSKSA